MSAALLALPPLAAYVYEEGHEAEEALRQFARAARASGLTLGGLLPVPCEDGGIGRHRCDMVLEDLSTGERFPIYEDRGREARGCRLDAGALAAAEAAVVSGLDRRLPDLLIVNKFGKLEAEGAGMRALFALALERGIPVLVGVPRFNLESFRRFAGETALEIDHPGRLSAAA